MTSNRRQVAERGARWLGRVVGLISRPVFGSLRPETGRDPGDRDGGELLRPIGTGRGQFDGSIAHAFHPGNRVGPRSVFERSHPGTPVYRAVTGAVIPGELCGDAVDQKAASSQFTTFCSVLSNVAPVRHRSTSETRTSPTFPSPRLVSDR